MSLQEIRSECTDVATLLQPFIDRELGDEEHERVAGHLDTCHACRIAVSEQLWVRSTVRTLERSTAPASLRERIFADLDEVDGHAIAPLRWARFRSALRGLARGSVVMLPATAVAAALFVVAMGEVPSTTALGTSLAISGETQSAPEPPPGWSSALAEMQPEVAPLRAGPEGSHLVQLVGARLDEPSARLMFRVLHDGNPAGPRIVARQRPAGDPPPRGTPITFRGQRYLLCFAEDGAPFLHFEHGGMAHSVRLESSGAARSPRPADASEDLALLLDVAAHLSGERE